MRLKFLGTGTSQEFRLLDVPIPFACRKTPKTKDYGLQS